MAALLSAEWWDNEAIQMPTGPDRLDIDAMTHYLEEGLDRIMLEPIWGVDISSLVGLYTSVYDHCTSQKAVEFSDEATTANVHRGAYLRGAELYEFLAGYIRRYLGKLKSRFELLSNQALIKYYLDEWIHFTNSAYIIHYIFRYLNRHWVKRNLDEGKLVYDVYTLHLVLWHREIFLHISDRLAIAISKLVENRRNGEIIEHDATKALINCIVSLRPDAADIHFVYKSIFELPLRKIIESFIPRYRGQNFWESSNIQSFDEKSSWLPNEEHLLTVFFGPNSTQQLTGASNNNSMVKLITKDQVVVNVERKVAERSFLIRHLCAYFGNNIISKAFIPLPNVNEAILRKILEWCDKHKNDPTINLDDDYPWRGRPPRNDHETVDKAWDQKFMEVDQETLFEIILASNYLDIGPLTDLGCKTAADMIRGKSPEEVRRIFNINFTPEEEERIRRENE